MNEIEKIKQIDKMFEAIPSLVGNEHRYGMCVHHRELVAEALVNAGYGDVKQAVRDFAEKVKEKIDEMVENWTFAVFNVQDAIDELVKEVCGE